MSGDKVKNYGIDKTDLKILEILMADAKSHRLALPFGTPKATMVDTSDEVSSTEVTAPTTATTKPTAVANGNGNGSGNGSRKRAGNILDAREARLNQTALRDASQVASDEQVSEPTVTTPTTDD